MTDDKTLYAYVDQEKLHESNDGSILKRKPHSISAGLIDTSKKISLNSSCVFTEAIFLALADSQETSRFKQKTVRSKRTIRRQVAKLIIWLNKQKIQSNRRFEILNDYVAEYLNEPTKTQRKFNSTGTRAILHMLSTGVTSPFLAPKDRKFISDLINATKIQKQETTQTSLNDWIALPQVRKVIGEKEFRKLASARILHQSFLASIGHTLTLIQEARSAFNIDHKNSLKLRQKKTPSPYSIHLTSVALIDNAYNFETLNKKEPSKSHRRILLHSILPPDLSVEMCSQLTYKNMADIRKNRAATNKSIVTCMESTLFQSNPVNTTDQILIGYLLAALAVQPTDITKIRVKDVVVVKNSLGKPISARCIYYKGRAGKKYETRALHAKEPVFKALIGFIRARSPEERLLPDLANKANHFPMKNTLIRSKTFRRTNTSLISSMWQDSVISSELLKRITATKHSPLFLNAFRALFREDTPTYMCWNRKQSALSMPSSVDDYHANFKYSLPTMWPKWSHIKTTAVHARSDRYRESDLINYNSHTSKTEKLSYLTDANKDWVNLHGRISRIVQHDIANNIYRPSLKNITKKAKTNFARTVITKSLNSEKIELNELGTIRSNLERTPDDPTNIIVIEIAETVVYMLHYLGEAERLESKLRQENPDHFYGEILVRVEWIAMILESITPKIVSDGQKSYYKIKNALPPLFYHELRAGPT